MTSEFNPSTAQEPEPQPEGVPAILTHDGEDVAGFVVDVMRDDDGNPLRYRFMSEDGTLGTVVTIDNPTLTLMGEPDFDGKTSRAPLEQRLDGDTSQE